MLWFIFAVAWFVLAAGIIVFNMGAHRGAAQPGEDWALDEADIVIRSHHADLFGDGEQIDSESAAKAWQEFMRNSSATTLSRP